MTIYMPHSDLLLLLLLKPSQTRNGFAGKSRNLFGGECAEPELAERTGSARASFLLASGKETIIENIKKFI